MDKGLICWLNLNTKEIYYKFYNSGFNFYDPTYQIGNVNYLNHEVIDVFNLYDDGTLITPSEEHRLWELKKEKTFNISRKVIDTRKKFYKIIDFLIK